MATLAGTDIYTKQTSKLHANLPDGQDTRANMGRFTATYLWLGAEATGDILPIVNIPVGANLHSMQVSTDGIGIGASNIASIGDAGSASRYSSTSQSINSALTDQAITRTNAVAITPFAVDTAANSTLLATLGTITTNATSAAGKKLVFRGEYRLP